MPGAQLYDTIGVAYTVTRRTEPRIAEQIWTALGDARTVLNVGAGTGSYEPPCLDVTAVEPSAVMRAQRPAGAAPCVDATAKSLLFGDQSFDAAMAFATIEHWQDPIRGLREMRRVARRVVVFTYDASNPDRSWLNRDYLPESAGLWADRPSLTELAGAIGARTEPVLVTWDCADGCQTARPHLHAQQLVILHSPAADLAARAPPSLLSHHGDVMIKERYTVTRRLKGAFPVTSGSDWYRSRR